MDPDELAAYRRVLIRLMHSDDRQERSYLLESDRSEIEAVLDEHDKAAAKRSQAFSPHKNRGGA